MSATKMKRTTIVSVALDEKVHYLCTLAARDQRKSMSSLIEYTIRKSLISGSFDECDDTVNMGNALAPAIMKFEGYWEADRADRLFLLARNRPDLLTEDERSLWKMLSESIVVTDRKLDMPTFRASFNDPMVRTSHLEKGDDA